MEAFHRNRKNLDGRESVCAACTKLRFTAWWERDRDRILPKIRARGRLLRVEHPERARGQRGSSKPNPQHQAARAAVKYALAAGKLIKPSACSRCGRDDLRIDGHHADYSQPLVVEWLCSACHGVAHWKHDQLAEALKGR